MPGPADLADSVRLLLARWIDNLTADPLSAFAFEVDLRGCVGLFDETMPVEQH